jgi:hypothetical protein
MSGQLIRLIDRDGQVQEADCCPNCEVHRHDLENAEADLRKARRRIKALEADKEKERQLYAHRMLVEGIFDFWRDCTGHAKSRLDGDRFDVIRARIEDGYTEEDCRLAILGAAVDPFVDPKRKRHDGIGLVFRNGEKLEDFANRAARWGARYL